MPTNPRAEAILDKIAEKLAAIVAGATYRTTVVKVEHHSGTYTQVEPSQRPWIGIVPIEDTVDPEPSNNLHTKFRIALDCLVHGPDETEKRREMFRLRKDILQALLGGTNQLLDAFVGGDPGDFNATKTTYVGAQYEGHPDNQQGSMRLIFEVTYDETTGDQ